MTQEPDRVWLVFAADECPYCTWRAAHRHLLNSDGTLSVIADQGGGDDELAP